MKNYGEKIITQSLVRAIAFERIQTFSKYKEGGGSLSEGGSNRKM